jgi:hypothetical protein
MHQLTKDILFLFEFGGELDPNKLNKLVDNALNRAYNDGHNDMYSRMQYQSYRQ